MKPATNTPSPQSDDKRILVFRRGALGDTLMAVPCLRLIRTRFPHAHITLLTVRPKRSNEASAGKVLEGTGLIDDIISYTVGTRSIAQLSAVWREIHRTKPQLAIHLVEPISVWRSLLESALLATLGPCRVIGTPWNRERTQYRLRTTGRYESEANRLARCLRELGDAKAHEAESFFLIPQPAQQQMAKDYLREHGVQRPFLVIGASAKDPGKDWGRDRWARVLTQLSQRFPNWTLLVSGATSEEADGAQLAAHWQGHSVQACGVSIPDSAALFQQADLYIGNDGGLMHLAASVGTPTVCVFNHHTPPGTWAPVGDHHISLYPTKTGPVREDEFSNAVSSVLAKQ